MGDFEQAAAWVICGRWVDPAAGRAAQASVGATRVLAFREAGMEVGQNPQAARTRSSDGARAAVGKAGHHHRRQRPVGHRVEVDFLARRRCFRPARRPSPSKNRRRHCAGAAGSSGEAEWAPTCTTRSPFPRGHRKEKAAATTQALDTVFVAGDTRAPRGLAHAAEGLRSTTLTLSGARSRARDRGAAGERRRPRACERGRRMTSRGVRGVSAGTAESRARYDGGFCPSGAQPSRGARPADRHRVPVIVGRARRA